MLQSTIHNRTIYCNDNLPILQGIDSGTIDLIYLDPPFNTKKTFTAPIGTSAEGASFKDIFNQEDVKEEWLQSIKEDNDEIHHLLNAVKNIEGGTSYDFCYLAYMAIRLIECRRILSDTGSIYLHGDSTMSHYLKLVLDCIFGAKNFRNEIVWCYHGPGSPKMRQFNRKSDSIFWYSNGAKWTFNKNDIRVPFKDPNQSLRQAMSTDGTFSKAQVAQYRKRGKVPENWWEIRIAARSPKEHTGYPTQKPLALLERIIKASSNEGDVVLDPFCGCATTCIAAEKLRRQWVGVDVSVKAYELVQTRIKDEVYAEGLLKSEDGTLPNIYFRTHAPPRTDTDPNTVEKKHVYVISHPSYQGWHKVGIARNLKSRVNSYQTSDPQRQFNLEYSILTEHYREIEQYIHDTLENKFEWVHASVADIVDQIEKYHRGKGSKEY